MLYEDKGKDDDETSVGMWSLSMVVFIGIAILVIIVYSLNVEREEQAEFDRSVRSILIEEGVIPDPNKLAEEN